MPCRMFLVSISPEVRSRGRSICVMSPVITLGVEPMRSKTFSSVGGGVLGLIEDDERIVQGPAAHERDGGDLDNPFSINVEDFSKRIMSCRAS